MTNHDANALDQTLTTHEAHVILIIASRLLSYPPDEFEKLIQDIQECMQTEIKQEYVREELKDACLPLFNMPEKELKELYVSTFDLTSNLGLYLTAHEFGDSHKRGAALIKLQKTINQAGYERTDGELADYIPMLFELLVVSPEPAKHIRLYNRLAIALHRMMNNMDEHNPYMGIFRLVTTHIFPKPTEKEIAEMENNREEADLEELPFPIMYQ